MADIENTTEIKLPTESQIKKSGFSNFMSRLFGWRRSRPDESGKIQFTSVDLGSDQRLSQALMDTLPNNKGPMAERLEDLFNSWLNDNTDKISELQARKQRIDQLSYMTLNDPYVGRTVALYADEATQLDDQDTVLRIETPDPKMTKYMYDLISIWGLTQNRIRATIEQLGEYGDGFWANKITGRGVERIMPLQQYQVSDRIEFNPVQALEMKKRRSGTFGAFASNNYLIDKMLQDMDSVGDFAEMFDTKLFGFMIDEDMIVPPWCITHFRVNADGSQFKPWGESPILGAIAPFKQTQSTITLQSLGRMMSFPITLFKVKTSESMDEARQFGTVNRVREAFDNIGVSPSVGNSEVYTNNTKLWIPDGLVSVETVPGKTESDDVDDVKLYQDREAIALGIPKSFFGDEGWYSGEGAGKALTRQYKPFARKVFSLQSAFLEGLSNLFRIHFAITGAYDFRTPFTISMKYPAVEETDERVSREKATFELIDDIVKTVKSAIGAGEDEALPPDIMRDIMAKYSFLNPSDIMKWTRDARFQAASGLGDKKDSEEEGPGREEGFSMDIGESKKAEQERLRESHLTEVYNNKKNSLYFEALKEHAVNNFVRDGQHVQVFNTVDESLELMLNTLAEENSGNAENRLKEGFIARNSKKKGSKKPKNEPNN